MPLSQTLKTENTFFLALIAAFTGGSVAVAAKIALEAFHPFTLISIRFFFATLFLYPLVMRSERITFTSLKKFAPMGVMGALNPILLFIALQYTQASVSPLLYASVPAMIALHGFAFQKIKINLQQSLGIILGFLGVGLIVVLPLIEKGIHISALKGNMLILLAAMSFAIYGFLSKQHQNKSAASPLLLTFYFSLVAFLFSLPFTTVELLSTGLPRFIHFSHVAMAIYIGVVGTGVFYLSYQQALKLSSELAATLFLYIQPIATAALAIIFLHEQITVPLIVGGLLAVVGARLASPKKSILVAPE